MTDQNEMAHDENEGVFIYTDEHGVDHELMMVYTFDAKQKSYAVLIDKNDLESDGLIFRMEKENDEEDIYLVSIEDDEEWDYVSRIYEEIVAQQ